MGQFFKVVIQKSLPDASSILACIVETGNVTIFIPSSVRLPLLSSAGGVKAKKEYVQPVGSSEKLNVPNNMDEGRDTTEDFSLKYYTK